MFNTDCAALGWGFGSHLDGFGLLVMIECVQMVEGEKERRLRNLKGRVCNC